MTCDCCNKPATVFLTQIVGDSMQKVNLCEDCSAEQGVTDPTGFALADLLTGIGSEKALKRPGESSGGGTACPKCGFTQADFKKTGRLGCPTCYDVFRSGLKAILTGMHRGTRHVGKVPENLPPVEVPEPGLTEPPVAEIGDALMETPLTPVEEEAPASDAAETSLEEALEQAIAQENYEEAARLRDEIQQRDAAS